jgi:hypothetical protein
MEDDLSWHDIPGFPGYKINRLGDIFNNRTEAIMRPSLNQDGVVKIGLLDAFEVRRTVSVALLVAKVFLIKPETLYDSVIFLDANRQNVAADNLAYRPSWFAWTYSRQFNGIIQPKYKIKVTQHTRDNKQIAMYDSIVAAAVKNGFLMRDIWRSINTYDFLPVYPSATYFRALR